MIILIFGPRDLVSVLAHASLHCITGLTLPPVDANSFHQLAVSKAVSNMFLPGSYLPVMRLVKAESAPLWLNKSFGHL
ncbi:hypothetical protein CBS147332_2197 [Penicillium roqueforti]|nr:hypothetical protein CBS147332_2197 [Penicillium roqueforti]KAI3106970.1 hypothetical protein CBS147331_6276 [Penicillium roqueforti]